MGEHEWVPVRLRRKMSPLLLWRTQSHYEVISPNNHCSYHARVFFILLFRKMLLCDGRRENEREEKEKNTPERSS